MKVADLFRGVLGHRAVAELERRGLARDLSKTCNAATLRTMLEQRGLPVYQAVLDFEERCGGVPEGADSYYGAFHAIQRWEAAHAGLARSTLEPDDLVSFEGQPLLPISPIRAGNEWMGEDGTIYHGDADVGECGPDASSYVSRFERNALWSEWEGTSSEKTTFLVKASVGAEVAKALQIPAYAPATDVFGAWWVRGGEWVIDRVEPYYYPQRSTLVHVDSIDTAVRAIQAMLSTHPQSLVEWYGANGPPPGADEPVVARVGWYDYRQNEAVGEILFVGSPGSYRIHRYYYEKFHCYDHSSFVWADYGKPSAEIPSPADWPGRQRPYRFSAYARVGAAVASALGAEPAPPPPEAGTSAWSRDGVEVKQQEPQPGVPSSSYITRVSVSSIEGVIRAMEAALAAEPHVPLWWDSDNRMPPAEGEPVPYRFPRYKEDGALAGEILIVGSPGHYRVHSRWFFKNTGTVGG